MAPLPLKCGHTIFHSRCSECKAIQAEYYQKLKEDQFEDIEDTERIDRPLNSWHKVKMGPLDSLQVESRTLYYQRAAQLLYTFDFKKPVHRYIWFLHCEGHSKRKIEKALAGSEFKKLKREAILNIIKKIAKEIMG